MLDHETGTKVLISDTDAAEVAAELYGICGSVQRLTGEFDQNFRLRDAQGQLFLLKFTPPHIGTARLKFQNALLEHVAAWAPHLKVPRLVMTRAGHHLWVDDRRGGLVTRVLRWVDGVQYCDWEPKTAALRNSLGAFVAELTGVLASFEYDEPPKGHIWDLACAHQHLQSLHFIRDTRTRGRAQHIFDRFIADIQPVLQTLPRRAIHGDVNDMNLLVSDDAQRQSAWGLIDFGDAAWSNSLCELAIAATYAAITENNPNQAIADVLDGYSGVRPLSAVERGLMTPLVETRLAVSLCISARRRDERPGDADLQVSAGPAAATLGRLASLPDTSIGG